MIETNPFKNDWVFPDNGRLLDLYLVDSSGNRVKDYF